MHRKTRFCLLFVVMWFCLLSACGDEKTQNPTPANNAAPNSDNNTAPNNAASNNTAPNNAAPNNAAPNNAVGPGVLVDLVEARSCEVTVRDASRDITEVTYGEGVEGRWLRRGDLVLLAFVRKDEAALGAGAVRFGLREQGLGAELVSARCFDARGVVLDDPKVTLTR